MARGYWINAYRTVTDPDKLASYVELGAPAVRANGGRFVTRGTPAATFEAGRDERTTVVEFDDVDAALAAYHSEDYQRALAALGDGAERDLRIVEGVPGSDVLDRARAVDEYADATLLADDPEAARIRRDTVAAGLPDIAVSAGEGHFLWLLARMVSARRVLEVGTLGGHSTLWFARAVGEDGSVVSLEYSGRHAEVARQNLAQAGVGDRVEIVVGAARDTIGAQQGPFDLVFVDADKINNAFYVEAALDLVRPGAVIVVDNVVRDGDLADADDARDSTRGARAVVELVGSHPRLDGSVLQTVGTRGYDGILVALVTG